MTHLNLLMARDREITRLGRVVKGLHEQLDKLSIPVANIAPLSVRVSAFAEQRFPLSTVESCATKLVSEAVELTQDPRDICEAADILIVLMTWLKQAGRTPWELVEAAHAKMDINTDRDWVRAPDGTYQHDDQLDKLTLSERVHSCETHRCQMCEAITAGRTTHFPPR